MNIYPERVWEPSEDADGELIFPLRWSSRTATKEDRVRRGTGQLQDWQIRHEKTLKYLGVGK